MQLLNCPLNGLRPIAEFAYGGEVRRAPNPDACADAHWSEYVFHRAAGPAVKREWWYHVPSAYWFIAERDTASGAILQTYGAEHLRERSR